MCRWKKYYMLKEESALPTVSTEAIFITSVIDAKENREVACLDLAVAFLHAENDQHVIMLMKEMFAQLMTLIAPQTYQK